MDTHKTKENVISLPTGEFKLNELTNFLNTLPMDITFVDSEDKIRYFSESKDRLLVRTKKLIGSKIQDCHRPQMIANVDKLLKWFKEGTRNSVDFWMYVKGRFFTNRYFAVKDNEGKYLGALEVAQDISDITPFRARITILLLHALNKILLKKLNHIYLLLID